MAGIPDPDPDPDPTPTPDHSETSGMKVPPIPMMNPAEDLHSKTHAELVVIATEYRDQFDVLASQYGRLQDELSKCVNAIIKMTLERYNAPNAG